MCGAAHRAQLTPKLKPANVNEVPGKGGTELFCRGRESRYTNGLAKLRQRMAQAHRRVKVRASRGTLDHVAFEIGVAALRPPGCAYPGIGCRGLASRPLLRRRSAARN